MSRFRLFGRPHATPAGPASPPPGGSPLGPPRGWGGPPPAGAGAPWPTAPGPPTGPTAGPATRSARPAASWQPPSGDPPTDPFGFPPIPVAPVPGGAVETDPHPAEAAALAGAFAVDYLSWDQDDPDRRGRVLVEYLPAPGSDPARLGWSGRGRQRADFALPGRVRPDGEGRVLVDVRVRVTPYRSVGEHGPESTASAEPEPDVAGVPSSAPAPTGRGWRSLASYWIRMSVPVASEGGRLVVDAWDETLGEEPAPPVPAPDSASDDHTLADDDPLVEPRTGGAW